MTSHLGKTEGAEERRQKHAGGLLVPPLSATSLEALRPLQAREIAVEGDSWSEHSKDIAIAGLGWVGVGVKGRAVLQVWVSEGVATTVHDSLIPDFAKELQRPGFCNLLPATSAAAAAAGGSKRGASASGKRR